jgi:hypothetical protein
MHIALGYFCTRFFLKRVSIHCNNVINILKSAALSPEISIPFEDIDKS